VNEPSDFAVEADGISKVFHQGGWGRRREVRAVADVSFRLRSGSTLAVVGESGSGKTTVARIVTGLETPSEGTVTILGRPRPAGSRTKTFREMSRQIQLVFQNPYRSLDPRQSVESAVAEFLRTHFALSREGRSARVAELLDLVGLPARVAGMLPQDLSGGQRQRVCIARALAA